MSPKCVKWKKQGVSMPLFALFKKEKVCLDMFYSCLYLYIYTWYGRACICTASVWKDTQKLVVTLGVWGGGTAWL